MSLKVLNKIIFLGWIFLFILSAAAEADQASSNIQNISRSASHNLSMRDTRKGREMLNFPSRLPDGELQHLPQFPKTGTALPSGEFMAGKFRVGVILPLSGEYKEIGQQFMDAIIMALFDINNVDIVLLPVDSRGTAEGAFLAAQEAYTMGAEVFVGPVFEDAIQGVAELAKARQIPIIGFSSNRNVAGEGVFLLNFLPEQQIEEIVSFAIENGVERFAALIPDTAYGEVVEEAYISNVIKYGGELTNIVHYPTDFDSIGPAVSRFVAATEVNEKDAILVPEGGMILISLVAHLSWHDIDASLVRILGTGLWDEDILKKEPVLMKGWYAAPDKRGWAYFSAEFKKTFGKSPHKVVSLAYDAMLLVSNLTGNRSSYAEMQKAIAREEGYMGINGLFRLWPGGLCERGLTIYEVGGNGPEEVLPAPSSFRQLTTPD